MKGIRDIPYKMITRLLSKRRKQFNSNISSMQDETKRQNDILFPLQNYLDINYRYYGYKGLSYIQSNSNRFI